MANLVTILGAFSCILMAASYAEAITCHTCFWLNYDTSDDTINSLLNSAFNSDAGCEDEGSDYSTGDTVSCDGSCYKTDYQADVTYIGISFTMSSITRGCAPSTTDSCIDYASEAEKSIESISGFSVDNMTADICYCSTDECNHGNMLKVNILLFILVALAALKF